MEGEGDDLIKHVYFILVDACLSGLPVISPYSIYKCVFLWHHVCVPAHA